MNWHGVKFPTVAVFHVPGDDIGTTFIMYNENSAVVIDHEPSSPYTFGQVISGRIGFRDEQYVTFEKMPFAVTKYHEKLEKLAKARAAELAIYNQILEMSK